jgi:hypothetical protein
MSDRTTLPTDLGRLAPKCLRAAVAEHPKVDP